MWRPVTYPEVCRKKQPRHAFSVKGGTGYEPSPGLREQISIRTSWFAWPRVACYDPFGSPPSPKAIAVDTTPYFLHCKDEMQKQSRAIVLPLSGRGHPLVLRLSYQKVKSLTIQKAAKVLDFTVSNTILRTLPGVNLIPARRKNSKISPILTWAGFPPRSCFTFSKDWASENPSMQDFGTPSTRACSWPLTCPSMFFLEVPIRISPQNILGDF